MSVWLWWTKRISLIIEDSVGGEMGKIDGGARAHAVCIDQDDAVAIGADFGDGTEFVRHGRDAEDVADDHMPLGLEVERRRDAALRERIVGDRGRMAARE